jgi:hypothetical protein
MFDQFQQTLVMLFQMMASMQQEQVALIRDELRQFQKTTEELNRLQEQVRSNRAADVPRSSAPATTRRAVTAGQSPLPPGEQPVLPPAGTADLPSNGDIHDWLTQRIGELQTERQNRWQRILGFIRGD